jgi:hypothetical protein
MYAKAREGAVMYMYARSVDVEVYTSTSTDLAYIYMTAPSLG